VEKGEQFSRLELSASYCWLSPATVYDRCVFPRDCLGFIMEVRALSCRFLYSGNPVASNICQRSAAERIITGDDAPAVSSEYVDS
jgi:hypothetical protein